MSGVAPTSSFKGSVVAISGGGSLQNPGISPRYGTTLNAPSEPVGEPPQTSNTYIPIPTPPAASSAASPQQPEQLSDSTSDTESTDQPFTLPFGDSPSTYSPKAADTSLTDSLLEQVYAFIPSSYSLPLSKPVSRTPEQQALYEYGNRAGLAILSFNNAHADMADVLTKWFEGRASASAAASAKEIATDMDTLGSTLLALESVPAPAVAAHQALARGYQTAAEKLTSVFDAAGNDSTLINAMKTYNVAVEDFTRSYIALADIFAQSGVTFAPSDAGSVFSMPK